MNYRRYFVAVLVSSIPIVGCSASSNSAEDEQPPVEAVEPASEDAEDSPSSPEPDALEPDSVPAEEPEPYDSRAPDDQELLPAESQGAAAEPVDDTEVTAFAETLVEVLQVRRAYETRIRQAGGDDARRLQMEAVEEVNDVIEAGDLEPERFSQIAELAERDPELKQRIEAQIASRTM